jgi:hypothetical protein
MKNLFKKSLPEPTVLRSLHAKLSPTRFPRMSPVMGAIVGFVVGAPFGDPPIAEIVIVHDGAVLARPEGAAKIQIIGCYDDLIRNWQALLACAGLTKTERIEAECLFASKIGYLFEASH